MNRKILSSVAIAIGMLSTASAFAAESAADAARRCAQILGERERLACFDRAFPAGPETAALAESRAVAAPAAAVVPVATAAVVPAATSVAAPVAAASVAAAATVAASPSLGDEQVRKSEKQAKEAASAPQNLTAKVTEVKQTRPDTWRINLDNGQIWQQMDMSSDFRPQVGDTVEVQRKMMGGYALALAGDKKSPWIRVTRLE